MKNILKTLLLLTFPAIIISLAGLEIALRIWWGDRPVSNPGAAHKPWFAHYVHWNKLGTRGQAPPLEKPAGTFRIVAVGDSITFGKGIEREKDRWPELLGDMISQQFKIQVDVVNLGFPAANTTNEYLGLRNVGMSYRPDMVLLGYCYNDPETGAQQADLFRRYDLPRALKLFTDRSYIAYFATVHLRRDEVESYSTRYYHTINAPDAPNIPSFRESLAGIFNLCKSAGTDFAVVIFPLLKDLDKEPYEFQDADDLIVGELKSLGGPYVDLLPQLKGKKGRELWVSPYDSHPNEQVHAMAAAGLFLLMKPAITKRIKELR